MKLSLSEQLARIANEMGGEEQDILLEAAAALAQQAQAEPESQHVKQCCANPSPGHTTCSCDCHAQQTQPESWAVEDCPLHPLCFRISHPSATTKIHAQHCAREDVIALAKSKDLRR